MRNTAIEALHLLAGLLAVALVSELAAWAYPPARTPIAWIARVVAAGVLLWSIPLFRAAWAKDKAHG